MRLVNADVDRYGPLVDCRPPCEDGITVVAGSNEAGKTLYLEALLQLLNQKTAKIMEPQPRVDEVPNGRVEIEHNGNRHICDGTQSITDVADIGPSHLKNIFIVRDNDLHLPNSQEYYTSLIEKLGDIHTSEINAIKAKLKDEGRLTKRALNISSSKSFNNAGDVKSEAEQLAADIRAYTTTIEEEDLDEIETERYQKCRELQSATERLHDQQIAATLAKHERLKHQLQQYREDSAALADMVDFDRETFDELKQLKGTIEHDEDQLEELDAQIEAQQSIINTKREQLEEAEEKQTALKQREPKVESTKSAVQKYRNRQDAAAGAERRLTLAKYGTLAALLGTGGVGIVAAVAGSIIGFGLAILLLVVGVLGAVSYWQANRRATRVEIAAEDVLRAARDAGFDVNEVTDVAPAIESFNRSLTQATEHVAKAEQAHATATEQLEEFERTRSKLKQEFSENKQELTDQLEEAGVDSLDAYKQTVEEREELTSDRRVAEQSLVDAFDDPDVDSDDPEAKAAAWDAQVASLIEDIDQREVSAEDHDEAQLATLDTRVTSLEAELESLEEDLSKYDQKLGNFESDAKALTSEPFIDETLQLESRSKAGLNSLAADIESVAEQIKTDAELSRKALTLFDQIAAEEEQKLTTLFEPDGPASRVFEQITDGRYREVRYDADDHEIVVERDGGRSLSPTELSQGTQDQLYFATRVSLAEQLLGREPGFFLLDDPFLGADPERLQRGFRTLEQLSEEGWQILYFTAKGEVRDQMVEEYDLSLVEMNELAPPP